MVFGLIGIVVLTTSYFCMNKTVLDKKMSATLDEDCLWSLGYGSNMDVKALEAKKHVKVLGKFQLILSSLHSSHHVQPFNASKKASNII